MRSILFLNFLFLLIFFNTIAEDKPKFEVKIDLENIFLKNRDIQEKKTYLIKDNIFFYFINYIEKNSFIEITLRTSDKNNQFFSTYSKLDLISKKKLSYMKNLQPTQLTDIYSFIDINKKNVFYYRIFENKKLKGEKCLIFVAGTMKNNNNLYRQLLNGVGCSTEIKLKHKNIHKILSSIEIFKND